MAAPTITILGRPAARSDAVFARIVGLQRSAASAGKKSAFRRSAGSDLRQAGSAPPQSRLLNARDQAGKRRRLTGIQVGFIKQLGDQGGGRRVPNAGNGREQLALLA